LVEKKDRDVVEHPGLVELGVEDNLPHSKVGTGVFFLGASGVPLSNPSGQGSGGIAGHAVGCRQNNPLINKGPPTGKLARGV